MGTIGFGCASSSIDRPPPEPPLRGLSLRLGRNISGAQNQECGRGSFRPHWGPGGWKITVAAVPFLRLPFPNQRPRSVFRRRGAHCAPAGRSGTGPYGGPESSPYFVGAAISRPRAAGVVGPYGQAGRFPHFVGAAHRAARLPPSRGKVPSACEADEGGGPFVGASHWAARKPSPRGRLKKERRTP